MKKKIQLNTFKCAGEIALLIQKDPFYRLVSKQSVHNIWLIVAFVNVVVYLCVGFWIKHSYPDATNLEGIFHDMGEIINSVNVFLILLPAFWTFYRWLPEASINYIKNIQDRGIISNNTDGNSLSYLLSKSLSTGWFHVIGFAGAIISSLYVFVFIIPAQKMSLGGLINFWYYTPFSQVFFFMLYFPANYVLFMFALRALAMAHTINRYFQEANSILVLYPLYPDKCGGMGNIGLLISKIMGIVVLIPISFTITSVYSVFVEGGRHQLQVFLIAYIIYLLVAPFVLLYLLWQPHKAMNAYRTKQLVKISELMQAIEREIQALEKMDFNKMRSLMGNYRFLAARLDLCGKYIPVWPISLPVLQIFSVASGSPIFLLILSFLLGKLG